MARLIEFGFNTHSRGWRGSRAPLPPAARCLPPNSSPQSHVQQASAPRSDQVPHLLRSSGQHAGCGGPCCRFECCCTSACCCRHRLQHALLCAAHGCV